jgi:NAD(P)-dependent dehydrogenase (short-subunit alcohol dehydrogenase family)
LADLDRLYETISKVKGRIDIVFANAGVGEFVLFGAVAKAHFDQLFNINVRGTLFTVQKALPLLNDGGSIILNGSVASVKGTAAFGAEWRGQVQFRFFVRPLSGWVRRFRRRTYRLGFSALWPTKLRQNIRVWCESIQSVDSDEDDAAKCPALQKRRAGHPEIPNQRPATRMLLANTPLQRPWGINLLFKVQSMAPRLRTEHGEFSLISPNDDSLVVLRS